ncbi:DegT/DnrJ/EryC1/StrS family aminotransferase [Pantoea agglomerans]|uniref:DegT/DnrJ/EryC1/StrS family aminotransferase n=1 Tax=Enterobacter agglomerans TaxID=549 RepID=UPI003BF96A1F
MGKASRVAVLTVCAAMTVLTILQLGATPLLIDADGDSVCLYSELPEFKLNYGLAAMIAYSIWGTPSTSESMLLLSRYLNSPLLEDST